MRPPRLHPVLLAALLAAGCVNRPASAPTDRAGAAPAKPAPLATAAAPLVARATTLNLVHIYVGASIRAAGAEDPAVSAARNLALEEATAVTLRDELRRRGFNVRAAEAAAARPSLEEAADRDAFTGLFATARALAASEPAPATVRHATHLHPNAPPLLFFAALCAAPPEPDGRRPAMPTFLGGFVADATSGVVLWSGRATTAAPCDDARVRQLAVELVREIPPLPSSPSGGAAAPR